MLKKILTYLTIGILAFQIPMLINLWPAKKLASSITELANNIKEITPGPVIGAIKAIAEEKAEAKAATEEIKADAVAAEVEPKGIIEQATNMINALKGAIQRTEALFWTSLLLSLLLAVGLYFLNKERFFQNLGLSLLFGGGISLLNAFGIHNAFIRNFPTTFAFIRQRIFESYPALNNPIGQGFIDRFMPDFIKGLAGHYINNNLIAGSASIGLGILSRWIPTLFGFGAKKSEEHHRESVACIQKHIDNCKANCTGFFGTDKECTTRCIAQNCSQEAADEYKRTTKPS